MKKFKKHNIAFITQNDDFEEHINFLRKKDINVVCVDESSNLDQVSFLVIDLKYEDDKAYKILNRINNNPNLSQMNVFVLVRTRNEMNKLSIFQNIRIIDYISASIKTDEFLEKTILRGNPIYNIAKTIVGENGLFRSEVDFLNLDDKDRLALRQLIHGWRVK